MTNRIEIVDDEVLTVEITEAIISGGGSGSSTFIGLTDTPSSYTGEAFQVVRVNAGETGLEFAAGGMGVRDTLGANRTYYVRTNGSDSNDGLTNNAGGAFLTIQHACEVAAAIDFGSGIASGDDESYLVTIQVAAGTYAETLRLPALLGGFIQDSVTHGLITLIGDVSTPSNVVIAPAGGGANAIEIFTGSNGWGIFGFKLDCSGYGIFLTEDSQLRIGNIHLAADSVGLAVFDNAQMWIGGEVSFVANAIVGIWLQFGGVLDTFASLTAVGSPAFSQVFCLNDGGVFIRDSGTFSGTATGTRYSGLNGARFTTSQSLLGDAAGTLDAGSTYNGAYDSAKILVGINDSSGNEELVFTKTSSAVNHLKITNAATGNAPSLSSAGDNTNVDLYLQTQGLGGQVYIDAALNVGTAGSKGGWLTVDQGINYISGVDRAGATTGACIQCAGSGGAATHEAANVHVSRWSSDTDGAKIMLTKSKSNTMTTHSIISSGDVCGEVIFGGSDGTDFEPVGGVRGEVDGTPGNNDMPGRLVFAVTADGATATTDRMTLKNDGGLIVGTSSTSPGAGAIRCTAIEVGDDSDTSLARQSAGHLKVETNTIWDDGNRKESIILAASDETTALTTGTAKITFRMPYAFTVTAIRASLTTAQTSGSIFTVDVNESGTTIISTKLTIDNTEKTTTTAATPAVISDSALADDAEITIDIDQVGDGTAKGLKVYLIGHQ